MATIDENLWFVKDDIHHYYYYNVSSKTNPIIIYNEKKLRKTKTKLLDENLWKQGVCHTTMALPFYIFKLFFKAKEKCR